jgi:hypothetical protein
LWSATGNSSHELGRNAAKKRESPSPQAMASGDRAVLCKYHSGAIRGPRNLTSRRPFRGGHPGSCPRPAVHTRSIGTGVALQALVSEETRRSKPMKSRHHGPMHRSKRPRPEGVALACPAKRGVGRREGPVGAVFVIGTPRGGGVRGESPAGASLGVNDQSNNLLCLSSRSSCSRMYFRTTSSSRPTVLT